jgi:hypothetical protein
VIYNMSFSVSASRRGCVHRIVLKEAPNVNDSMDADKMEIRSGNCQRAEVPIASNTGLYYSIFQLHLKKIRYKSV